jgi:hypothetical protein
MIRELGKALSLAVGIAALFACGTGDPTAGIDRGGVRTPVSVVGPITGFGSIVVNGVHYAIDHAAVTIDGDPGTASDLELGQLVSIEGDRDADGANGAASTVKFQTNVRGAITALDSTISQFDLGTRPAAFGSLAVGDSVAVSGFVSSRGAIEATRIAIVDAHSSLLAFGLVSSLDSAALRFNIGALVVDYSHAQLIEGFASGGPSNGDRVVVKGPSVAPNGALRASEVRHASDDEPQQGREAEVEGLITRFVSPLDFDVSGRAVTTTASTVYQGGGPGALALNTRVEVEGTADANGVIVARRVEIDD